MRESNTSYGRAIAFAAVTGGTPLLLALGIFATADAFSDASADAGSWLSFGLRVWAGPGSLLGAFVFLTVTTVAVTRRRWTRIELGSLTAVASAISMLLGNLIAGGTDGVAAVLVLVELFILFLIVPLTFVLAASLPRRFGIPAPCDSDPRISDWVNAKVGR